MWEGPWTWRASSRAAPAGALIIHPAAILLGLAGGWQWAGMKTIVASALDPLPATTTMVGTIALLAAAVGPWLPERLVFAVAGFIRQRSRRGGDAAANGTGTFWMLRAVRQRDASLMWLGLSVLAAGAGGVSLLTLALSPVFVRAYEYLLAHFFWTNLTLTGLEWLGLTLLIGPSWVMHGVAVALLAPVVGANQAAHRWSPGVVSGLMLGVGTAWVTRAECARWALSGRQEFMAGVLVMFLLAAVAARRSQRVDRLSRLPSDTALTAPEVKEGGAGLIWFALVVWGAASVLVASGWLSCRALAASGTTSPSGRLGWYFLATALGMVAAGVHGRRRRQSASGCGMAAWASGLAAGIAATLTSYGSTSAAMELVQLVVAAVPFGYALHYAERAWLARAGSQTLGFAQLTSAVLAGLGIGLIAVRWWALPLLGPMGAMTAGALLVLAAGGLMQVYEEGQALRIRQLRLAVVFASLAGAIALFPSDTRRWGRWERQVRARSISAGSVDLTWLRLDELPPARRVCLIGVDPVLAIRGRGAGGARVDILPLVRDLQDTSAAPIVRERTRIFRMSAFRSLRLEQPLYDLIYQAPVISDAPTGYAAYTAEWLNRLARQVMPGGQLVIDVPLADMNARAIAVVATTFQHAMAAPGVWAQPAENVEPVIRLMSTPGRTTRIEFGRPTDWTPIAPLLADHRDLRSHSIRRDTLTPTLSWANPPSAGELERWLAGCRTTGHPGETAESAPAR